MGHTMNTIGCMGFAQLVYMFVDFDRSFDHILLGLVGGGALVLGIRPVARAIWYLYSQRDSMGQSSVQHISLTAHLWQ